jgi:hypothetical protein
MSEKYKRDIRSGAAVLADKSAMRDYLQKKNVTDAMDAMKAEINRLQHDLQALKSLLETNEKR